MSTRIIVAIAGATLAAGGLIAAAQRDQVDAAIGAAGGLAAGLLLAGAVAAWRRSWQRSRTHRGAWGRLAWACLWLAVLASAWIALRWDAVLLVSPTLGALLLGLATVPAPSRSIGPPRFADDWVRVEPEGGRLSHEGVSLVAPPGWTAWRVAASGDQPEALALIADERRWDLPIPIIGFARLSGEAGSSAASPEELVEQLRAGLGGDLPLEITQFGAASAVIAGETAVAVNVEARLRSDKIPVPGPVMAFGRALLGIRPIVARLYVVDRASERWAMGWLGWADGASRLASLGERLVGSVHWDA